MDISEHESVLSTERAEMFVRLLALLGPAPNSILDVGCRAGLAIECIKDRLPNTRVVGVDLLEEALSHAEMYADECVLADAADMRQIGNADYDWVFCSHTLEHCPDIPKVVDELVRVSGVGLFIVVPLESDAKFESYKSKTSPDGELGMHQFNSMDPCTWIDFFRDKHLVLYQTLLSAGHSDLIMVWLHEGVIFYGGKVYS